jgi:hypothetical protein
VVLGWPAVLAELVVRACCHGIVAVQMRHTGRKEIIESGCRPPEIFGF